MQGFVRELMEFVELSDADVATIRRTAPVILQHEQALTAAGVEHELVTYDGAPHSFFDRRQEDFADASEDAWARVLAFVERHSQTS